MKNRKIIINSLPDKNLSIANFKLVTESIPEPGEGEILCRTLALSIDAGTRTVLNDRGAGTKQTDIVMPGGGIARVEKSNNPNINEGDIVICNSGWQDYSVHIANTIQVIDNAVDINPVYYIGALGHNGLTAYFGLLNITNPQKGQTLAVSAAAGAVGHIVGQIGKIKGCKVIGITGSDNKCSRLVDELGFSAAVNYKTPDFSGSLKEVAPKGVDIYFDNTGGFILETVLQHLNPKGHIACCGVVSQYDTNNSEPTIKHIPQLIVKNRIKMEGFIVSDYATGYAAAQKELSTWIKQGELIAWQDEFSGLERAPEALIDLLSGGNFGKRIVRVDE